MQTTNLTNSGVGHIWNAIVNSALNGEESPYMIKNQSYYNSSSRGASMRVSVRCDYEKLEEFKSKHVHGYAPFIVILARCMSYEATIRVLAYNLTTNKFEHWVNNASYSHTTGRHQSQCAVFSNYDNTFDFTPHDGIHHLDHVTNRDSEEFAKKQYHLARDLGTDAKRYINTPRRQRHTTARYCKELLTTLYKVEHLLEGNTTAWAEEALHTIYDLQAGATGCADFDGDKAVFNAVFALHDIKG